MTMQIQRLLTSCRSYAEFEDSVTGVKDDVEFLFSADLPIVGFRSARRTKAGHDGNDHERPLPIRDVLHHSLRPKGWMSVT